MPHGPAARFDSLLDARRKTLALDRGLLLARIVVPPPPHEDHFEWLMAPPVDLPPKCRWFIVGSLIHGKLPGAPTDG